MAKAGDRRAQVCLRRVPELHDERVVLERLLDDAPLNTFAASVNQPHLAQACFVCRADVFLDDGCDVARRKGVEVERGFDGNLSSRMGRRGRDDRLHAAADGEVADDGHAPRLTRGDEIVEDLIGDRLEEDAAIAEPEHVVLERLQLDAALAAGRR